MERVGLPVLAGTDAMFILPQLPPGVSPHGEPLTSVGLDSLRACVDRYLDTGVDFIKYGATDHGTIDEVTMVFSPEAQRVIVEEAHKRGLPVETTPNRRRRCARRCSPASI